MLVLLILLVLPVPLVLVVLFAGALMAALLAVMRAVTMRGFRLRRRLGGLLCGGGADAERRGGRGTEGKVAKCFHLDLLWV